jgi:glutamate formiminotransferase
MGKGPLLGVVPNYSEGRRLDVVEAICEAMEVPGAHVVHRQADADHNRLDTTVIGTPAAVQRSAMAGATCAVQLIDMDRHRGSHPRMGAVDVIPFVPIRDLSMGAVIGVARVFAQEIAHELDIPVYLYDRAALTSERRSLADVRRGEYEGLKAAVARGERLPDVGPSVLGRAGAVAIGARVPLVAFNLYLDGADEASAKAIAREIRESNGGLPGVRAIGFYVAERGRATVSMNLVDHALTGPRQAFDAVAAKAAERGARVAESEIVGLVPEAALRVGDIEHVRLTGFDPDRQILERLVTAGEGA